jgi:hypothetical protein
MSKLTKKQKHRRLREKKRQQEKQKQRDKITDVSVYNYPVNPKDTKYYIKGIEVGFFEFEHCYSSDSDDFIIEANCIEKIDMLLFK